MYDDQGNRRKEIGESEGKVAGGKGKEGKFTSYEVE